jgi:TRAP transporter 4TM/12TM fusion protein
MGYFSSLVSCIAVAMSLFHLATGSWWNLESYLQRLIHIAFAFLLLILVAWEDARKSGRRPGWTFHLWQAVLLALLAGSLGYIFWNYDYLARQRFAYVSDLTPLQIALGLGLLLVTVELCRRTMGWGMASLAVVFSLYPFLGPYLPGILHHDGFSLSNFVDSLVYTTDGIFGIPVAISAGYIVLFILFGAVLEATGFGQLLLHLSTSLAGSLRGGPAKVAVLASALTGMISGSVVANVTTTGTFTIPLMKRTGYRPEFAAAAEATASTGGQFMPPVMGAQAFIMTEYTGVPYARIAWHSLLPAVLYYLAIWFNLDLEARRLGLRGLSREEVGHWRTTVLPRLHLLLPVVLLVVLMAVGYTPMYAVIVSIAALLLVALVFPATRYTASQLWRALDQGARSALTVAAASAVSGVIIAAVTLTGLGQRFSSAVLSLAGGNLYLALFFAMVAALVLGMGMPTVPAYIVQVALVIPVLVELGLPPLVAHLFASYFSCISMITPPVAIGAYAAAGLAEANPTRTAIEATRIGLVGYIIPYMFAFNPPLLLMGSPFTVVWAIITAAVGVFALAVATQGYWLTRVPVWQRLLAFAGAVALIKPGFWSDAVGLLALAAVHVAQRRAPARGAVSAATGSGSI